MVDVRSEAENLVKAVLGGDSEDAVSVLVKAANRSYDEKKIRERLLDEGLAAKNAAELATRAVQDFLPRFDKSRKRSRKKFEEFPDAPKTETPENGSAADKKPKLDAKAVEDAMDKFKVKQIMAEAQRNIEEAKRRLKLPTTGVPLEPKSFKFAPAPLMPTSMLSQPSLERSEAAEFMAQALEKARKRAELSARIAARLPGAIGDVTTRPKPIDVDAKGRAVDKTTGKPLAMIGRQPELKANQRELTQSSSSTGPDLYTAESGSGVELVKPTPEAPIQTFVDPRVSTKGPSRLRRQFKWGEKGEYEAIANRERAKAKLDKLQTEISLASKKTGISSAVKLAMVAPKASELQQVEVPETEWWDAYLFAENQSYESLGDEEDQAALPLETIKLISNLVEHPIQLKPPTEPSSTQFIKVYLTKEEKRKLRRHNRRDIQREQQEKIRLGLMAPPEPKVKLTNLMRVLGTDAIQDPTKMEAAVRAQMAARVRKHEAANAARKLTKEQRSEKKRRRLAEDTSLGVQVAVYRVLDLSHQAHKFKVETNAKQLQMTGIVVLHKDVNVVVVEGGPKQQKFYKNLMLKRIKWNAVKKAEEPSGAVSTGGEPVVLVWEGFVKHRSFSDIRFKACPLEKQARELFQKFGVPQYWDMAYNGSILSQELDTIL